MTEEWVAIADVKVLGGRLLVVLGASGLESERLRGFKLLG